MKLLLLNAPPRSGKDAIATHLYHTNHNGSDVVNVLFDRMSMPIKAAFVALMGTDYDEFGNADQYEANKDAPIPILGNVSYRQWQIDFSEKFMKPLYGNDIFGKLMLDRLQMYEREREPGQPEYLVVIPDCGFQIEIDVLMRELPPEDIALFHINRPGCTWAGDSREWVRPPTYGRNSVFFRDIMNDGTLDELHAKVSVLVDEFLTRKVG